MNVPNRRRRKVKNKEVDLSTLTNKERKEYLKNKLLNTPVAELNLSVRVINTLENSDIIMISDLVSKTYEELVGITNFGDKTLDEVKKAMKALGIDPPSWIPVNKGRGGIIEMW